MASGDNNTYYNIFPFIGEKGECSSIIAFNEINGKLNVEIWNYEKDFLLRSNCREKFNVAESFSAMIGRGIEVPDNLITSA